MHSPLLADSSPKRGVIGFILLAWQSSSPKTVLVDCRVSGKTQAKARLLRAFSISGLRFLHLALLQTNF